MMVASDKMMYQLDRVRVFTAQGGPLEQGGARQTSTRTL